MVPWRSVVADEPLTLPTGDVLRLESPGGAPDVRRGLLALGAAAMAGQPGERLSAAHAGSAPDDGSGLRYPRQQQLGFEVALRRIGDAARAAALRCTTPHRDVIAMADKAVCHRRFREAGLSVPPRLAATSAATLGDAMDAAGVDRAFVKLRYGSSAAGMAAWDRASGALTTSLRFDGDVPFSSLRLRTLTDRGAVDRALSWLFSEGAHAELWLPKSTHGGCEYDLRVVVIAGRARHVVVRVARDGRPMTNLHLGNDRGDRDAVRAALGPALWARALALCEAAAALFPDTLCAGVDVAIVPGQGPVLLEINAFGDLLPGVLHEGVDTYEAQLRALQSRLTDGPARPAPTDPAA